MRLFNPLKMLVGYLALSGNFIESTSSSLNVSLKNLTLDGSEPALSNYSGVNTTSIIELSQSPTRQPLTQSTTAFKNSSTDGAVVIILACSVIFGFALATATFMFKKPREWLDNILKKKNRINPAYFFGYLNFSQDNCAEEKDVHSLDDIEYGEVKHIDEVEKVPGETIIAEVDIEQGATLTDSAPVIGRRDRNNSFFNALKGISLITAHTRELRKVKPAPVAVEDRTPQPVDASQRQERRGSVLENLWWDLSHLSVVLQTRRKVTPAEVTPSVATSYPRMVDYLKNQDPLNRTAAVVQQHVPHVLETISEDAESVFDGVSKTRPLRPGEPGFFDMSSESENEEENSDMSSTSSSSSGVENENWDISSISSEDDSCSSGSTATH